MQRYPPPPKLSQVLENLQGQGEVGARPLPSIPPLPCQHSLVFGVREGTGTGLAVFGGTGGGIPVETRGTLVTEIPRRVVQASLGGEICKYLGVHSRDETPSTPKNLLNVKTHGADAALGVAALRMPVALAELTVPQVQPPPGAGVTGGTILPGGEGKGREVSVVTHPPPKYPWEGGVMLRVMLGVMPGGLMPGVGGCRGGGMPRG